MKRITMQIQDHKGTVIDEQNLSLGDKDILVAKFSEGVTRSSMESFSKYARGALSNGSSLLLIPDSITLQVIKVGE